MRKLPVHLFLFFFISFGVFFCAQQGKAVTLKTLRIEESVLPGTQSAHIIELFNEQQQTITLYPTIEGFTDAGDESGNPHFIPIDPDVDDLPNWILFNREYMTLHPGETAQAHFVIHIPDNASPGGHYATIFFTTEPPKQDGSQVRIGTKIGTLVILDVAGDVREEAFIESFHAQDGFLYNYLPITFVSRVKNAGNVHVKPKGVIKIKNMLGITTAEIPFNGVQGNVLPDSTRRFEDVWAKGKAKEYDKNFFGNVRQEWDNFGFGLYSAKAVVDVGRNEPHLIQVKQRFIVFPWRLTLLALTFTLFAFYLLRLYDASVVRRAQRAFEAQKKTKKTHAKKESRVS